MGPISGVDWNEPRSREPQKMGYPKGGPHYPKKRKELTLSQDTFNENVHKGSKVEFVKGIYPTGVLTFQKFVYCKSQDKSDDATCGNCKGKMQFLETDSKVCGRNASTPGMMNCKFIYIKALEDALFDI